MHDKSSLFSSVDEQIAFLRRESKKHKWPFTDKDFLRASETVPLWPKGNLSTLVLVPYFPDHGKISAVEKTYWELCRILTDIHRCVFPGIEEKFSGKLPGLLWNETIGLQEGLIHESGLHWESICLNANFDQWKRPVEGVFPDEILQGNRPHAGILAASFLHPNWIRSINRNDRIENIELNFPTSVLIPGYTVCGTVSPHMFLTISFDQDDFCLVLGREDVTRRGVGSVGTKKAIPEFYKP